MRLDWLEDILAVAETGSFADAALRRRLTPSAFSRRIATIEQHLGAPLFDRTRKPAGLHPAVLRHLDDIAQLSAGLRHLIADLRQGGTDGAGRVVLASQHALTTALTPALIRSLGAAAPDLRLHLRSENLDDCYAALLSRQADVALVYAVPDLRPPVTADYLETVTVAQDRLIPVAAPGTVPDTGDLPVIAYPPEVFLGRVFARHLRPALGPRRLVARIETALTHAALELARQGLGTAWVPETLAAEALRTGALRDLTGALPDLALAVQAVRLTGPAGAALATVWSHLTRQG